MILEKGSNQPNLTASSKVENKTKPKIASSTVNVLKKAKTKGVNVKQRRTGAEQSIKTGNFSSAKITKRNGRLVIEFQLE